MERLKPVAGVGAVAVAVLAWVFAFQSSSSSDWNNGVLGSQTETRGRTVVIHDKAIETPIEREKRLEVKAKALREELGNMKKSILGDNRKTRGDDIWSDGTEVPEGFNDYSPRDACLQMQLQYPEKFGNLDCMSDKYDNPDPWHKVGINGQ